MADTHTSRAWSGWITFAGVLLAVLGALNILEGFVALLRHQIAFIDGDSLVVVNLTGLGIVMIVFGALLALAGIGLLSRNRTARIAAIVIVALHALAQIGSLGAFPIWSLLMITLDVIILFALTVHWPSAQLEPHPPAPAGGAHRADQRDHQPSREPAFPMNQPHPPAHAADQPPPPPPGDPHHTVTPTSGPGA
ncbi:DUF7144 family membrane protein [Dactylosporangium sp. CA-233914]|uniref:DUF7144 family membrane protein n=1 Tax=Dactylosporangium sp. CA-233914 TaxID=3239934 RepID=UPI003D9097BF